MHTQHDARTETVDQGEIPIVHKQTLFINETRINAAAGLSADWSLSLEVPLKAVKTTIRYVDTMDDPVELAEPNVHHRNEIVSGIGDPTFQISRTDQLGGLRITGRAGVSIPLGRTERDPFVAALNHMPHQHIQLGTGTFNPVATLEAAWSWPQWRLWGFAHTMQVLYENDKTYQPGDRYAGGVLLRRTFGKWSARGGIEVEVETAERWAGETHQGEGNAGRTDLMASGGASWAAFDRVAFDLGVKVPFYTRGVGAQVSITAFVELGVSVSLGRPVRRIPSPTRDEHDNTNEAQHPKPKEAAPANTAHEAAAAPQSIELTPLGFVPRATTVERGKQVTLQFLRKTPAPCDVVLQHDGGRLVTKLPLETPVDVTVTFEHAGDFEYGCDDATVTADDAADRRAQILVR